MCIYNTIGIQAIYSVGNQVKTPKQKKILKQHYIFLIISITMATNVANATKNVENVYCLTSRIKSSNPKVGQYSFRLLETKEPFETGNYWLLWDKKQTKLSSAQTWAIQNDQLFVVFGKKIDQIYLRSIGRNEFKRVNASFA